MPSASKPKLVKHQTQPWTELDDLVFDPNQFRWPPVSLKKNEDKATFPLGLSPICGNGEPLKKDGFAVYLFEFEESMVKKKEAFSSSDGDFMLLPREGALDIFTELGKLFVRPGELVVLPRGLKFSIDTSAPKASGYALELFQGHFTLPPLGAIGSSGLANPRDFLAPVAAYIDEASGWTILNKFANKLYKSETETSCPLDVVAWHGSYFPYKYDLGRFSPVGAIAFDHPDPSIFTVLTAPSTTPGTGIVDFAIFPERILCAEDTFRPPWFHRNTMSEFMGLLGGVYDGKAEGFLPGGASLHNIMAGHGVDKATWEKESGRKSEAAVKVGEGGVAFMWESDRPMGVTRRAMEMKEETYQATSWGGYDRLFKLP